MRRSRRKSTGMAGKVQDSQGPVDQAAGKRAWDLSQPIYGRHHLALAGPAETGGAGADGHEGRDRQGLRKPVRAGGQSPVGLCSPTPRRPRRCGPPAIARPDDFAALARQNSEDSASASAGGLIPPIRHFVGDPQLEKLAFEMPEGSISPVVQVQKQFVIMKIEARLPGTEMDQKCLGRSGAGGRPEGRQDSRRLARRVQSDREASGDRSRLWRRGKAEENAGRGRRRGQSAGHDSPVGRMLHRTTRHRNVDRLLDRKLLTQELHIAAAWWSTRRISIRSFARSAALGDGPDQGGWPVSDVAGWFDQVTKQQHMDIDVYMMDAVWPSVC